MGLTGFTQVARPERRSVVALAWLLASACSAPPSRQARWFYALGAGAQDSGRCVRAASALRAECRGDLACQREVSLAFSYHCYSGVYQSSRAPADRGQRDLGPCFLQVKDSHDDAEVTAVARSYCSALTMPVGLVDHCIAELQFAIQKLCWMGDPALTGAGP